MAINVTNYQCPSCTGPLRFSSDNGKLGCEYCGELFEVATIEQLYAEKNEAAANAQDKIESEVKSDSNWNFEKEEWGEEAEHMRAYNCPSCGAELICDDTTVATSCPYCNNPTVVPGQFSGMLKPDFVIPFKLDKEAAILALKNHYKGKRLLPKSFSDGNKLEEIKGIYVPFWLFNGSCDADLQYKATTKRSYTEGNDNVTVTEYYDVIRKGSISFEKVPVDGSTKMPDDHMDAIEPFDYSELVPFSSAYLPGFLADKYDLDANACNEKVNERFKKSTKSEFESTIQGYESITPEKTDIKINAGEVNYAFLPVWMLSTRWNDKDFLFAMNGQTGKLIGDLPVDWKTFYAYFAGISLPLMAILGTIFFWGGF